MIENKENYKKMLTALKRSFVADLISRKKNTDFEVFILDILNEASVLLGDRVTLTVTSTVEP